MHAWTKFRWNRHITTMTNTVKREQRPALLVLPSIPASYLLAQRICESRAGKIIGNSALMKEWAPPLARHVQSPLSVWRQARTNELLPWPVISFPDQLVGTDSSYCKLEIAGESYAFSIIEIMLLMRFRPSALVGQAIEPASRKAFSTLSLERFTGALPDSPSASDFNLALAELMRGVVACQRAAIRDWNAREVFSLKVGNNFERMLSLKLLEIEALIRQDPTVVRQLELQENLLDQIKVSRKKLLRSTTPIAPTQPRESTQRCAAPAVPPPFYSALPRWLLAADRMQPMLRFRWPQVHGGTPPKELLERFDRYEVTALTHKLRTRRLHADALAVRREELDGYVENHVIADVDALRGWMNSGAGAIFACPHYGPFLSGALLFASLGSETSPSHVFYDPAEAVPENRRFDELFRRFSGRLNVLHNQPRDLVKASRALRSKQCISIMFDVVQQPTDSMFVSFCGRLYPAMGGAAYLSLQSAAPLIPAYVVPGEERKAHVVFGTPILPENFTSADREQNVYEMTQALFRDFEQQLAIAPWHWIYWDNVVRAPRFNPDVTRTLPTLQSEVRRRVLATPALLDVAPALGELVRPRGVAASAGAGAAENARIALA